MQLTLHSQSNHFQYLDPNTELSSEYNDNQISPSDSLTYQLKLIITKQNESVHIFRECSGICYQRKIHKKLDLKLFTDEAYLYQDSFIPFLTQILFSTNHILQRLKPT